MSRFTAGFALVVCLSLPVFGVTRSWTGAVNGNWSEPNNWTPSGTPSSSDALIFPAGVPTTMNNDLPADTAVGSMTFHDTYTLNGNPLTLNGNVVFDTSTNIYWFCNVDLKLGQSINVGASLQNVYTGTVDVNGHTLTTDWYNTEFHGAFKGTGSIVAHDTLLARGGGTFSGNISGAVDVAGSTPNANVDATSAGGNSSVSGSGSLGDVTATYVSPGARNPATSFAGQNNQHTIGTLQVHSPVMQTYFVDVTGGTSDQLKVIGAVNLGGVTLNLSVPSGSPPAGDTFTIIDNDGSDAVNGTFSGLAEGATLTAGSFHFAISYHDGDGNDVVLTALASTKSWTGAASGNWSDPSNWNPHAIPANGEELLFPAGVPTTMNNDLSGLTAGRMTFKDTYTLNGNPLTLGGNVVFDTSTNIYWFCYVDLKLGQSINLGASLQNVYAGTIDVNGHTLTTDWYNTEFHGAIKGTGSIVAHDTLLARGGGTFSGNISGAVDVAGPSPNANVAAPSAGGNSSVSGSGSLGDVTATYVSPGARNPATSFAGQNNQHTIGTLQVHSPVMQTYFVDVTGGTSDQLKVIGAVNLGGVTLNLSVPSGSPAAGDTFTIIDNDGSDAVNGTFSGLAEGATLTAGSFHFAISYHDGDGNDVVLTALASTKSWTGAASGNWSDPSNWNPHAIPANGEELLFPAGVPTTMNNDLSGLTAGRMTFKDTYTLNGNPLTLGGNVVFDTSTNIYWFCYVDLKLGQSINLGASLQNVYAGTIDVNGHTLTTDWYNTEFHGAIKGTGSIVAHDTLLARGGGTFSGNISGAVDVAGSMPNANVDATSAGGNSSVSGSGSLGDVTATYVSPGARNPATSFAGQNNQHTIGTLQVHSPVMQTYFVDVTGGTSDQLKVIGAVNLGGVTLNLSVPSGSPPAGDTFTIIDNDGSDAVNGTFSGLAEGATLTAGSFHFAISYHDGDGNDVVLTALASTKSWTGAASGNWSDPSNWNPHAIPANGEELLFPAGVPTTMNNDLSGLTAGRMTFKDTYTLNGNPLTLGGNVVFDTSTNIYWFCYVDLKLGQSINLGASLQNVYAGTIDVNGHTLTTDWDNTEFHGAIKGTCSIVAHDTLLARGGGTFSGNISGAVAVAGSMPNANVDATSAGGNSSVSGSGSLGDVTATYVSPGARNPATSFAGQNNQHTIGTLQVRSPVMQTYFADLVPGGTSDQLKVIGAVNLGGVNLNASVPAGAPATGEAFTIIDNDGSDAVNGSFSGLPEGASLTISGFQFTISYHGGDGNDVVLATVASTKSWSGAASGNWSDPSNWTPHAIPGNGEELLFPAGARTTMNNDLSGLTAGRMTFKDTYTLNGNPLTLGGNVVFDTSTNIYWFCNADLKLGQSINLGASLQNVYTGTIDVNGHTLTTDWYNTEFHGAIKGTGSIVAHDALLARGGGTFSGNISGAVDVAGSMPNANVDTTSAGGNASVSGNGSLGNVTTIYLSPGARNPATSYAGQNNQHTIGTLEVHSPAMQTYFVDLVPGGTSDQLKVTGAVHLSGVTVDVSIPSGAPSTGQTFTIIDNDGADAVSGTFKNLPEGARVNVGPYPFRITYQGGDGNDVVLTSAAETSVVVIQSAASTVIGEPVTFVATASSQTGTPAGTPVGSVTLMIDGVPAGTSSLQQGSTQFSTATLHAGQHSIVAVYAGDGSYLGGASAPVTHEVKRGPTNIAMALNKTAITFGDTIVATVSLAVVAPAVGVPTGTITIRADGNEVASAPVANGGAAIPLASLHGGTHALTATYGGNDDFASSESSATSVTVEQVATTLNVTAG